MAQLKIAFVVNRIGTVELFAQPLLAAIARRQGHVADLFEYARNPRKTTRAINEFAPDIMAYSVCSNEAQEYLAINRALKSAMPFFGIFGGPHATYTPSLIHEEGVDAVCRGEGDVAFPMLLDRWGLDTMLEVPNFSFKLPDGNCRENPLTDLIADLDSVPFPARDLLYSKSPFIARNPVKGFMAGRGCPYECAYCFNHIYHRLYRGKGQNVRAKGISFLLDEIRDVARRYPLTFIRFYDDLFGADMAWLAEFAERFPKEIGVPFSCNVRPNRVSKDHVRLLQRAGCFSVYTAIECGNERLRNEVLGRLVSNDQIMDTCAQFKAAGIRVITLNMVGVPGETEEDILGTIRLNQRIGADFADVTVFQPYPGTQAAEYCREHGYISEDAHRFESMYVASILDVEPAFKQRVFALHKLFAFLVDHPNAEPFTRFLPNTSALNSLLTFFYRLYYGRQLHRHAFASKIPFRVQARGAFQLLFSRNRV